MSEASEPTAAEQGAPDTSSAPPPDPDQQAAALEQEIRTRNNPEEVGRRLAMTALEVRRMAFATLMGVTLRFTDRPDVIRRLLAVSSDRWTRIHYSVVRHLCERGERALALEIYGETFPRTIQSSPSAGTLREAAEMGIELKQDRQVAEAIALLLPQAENDPAAAHEAVSLTYHCARNDRPEDAQHIWEKLLKAWPRQGSIRKSYARFMRESISHIETISTSEKRRTKRGRSTRHFEEVKALAVQSRLSELLRTCEEDITASADDGTFGFWINMTRVIASELGDVRTANRLWAVILKHSPQRASSFLSFSGEFNAIGRDPETDRLIRHAHTLHQETKRPIHKTKGARLKGSSVNTEVLDMPITINAVSQTAQQWVTRADEHVTARDFVSAFRIWTALLLNEQRLIPSVTRGLIRIATETPLERALAELRIVETIRAVPAANNLFHAIAANLVNSHPVLARQILYVLKEYNPGDPGNCLALAEVLMKQERFDEATRVWLPLWPSHANSCARCASSLTRHRQHTLARTLFIEVAKVSPAALIRHGYEYFQDPAAADIVLDCIEPILPTGKERGLAEHQVLALKLFVRHSARPERARIILSQMVNSGAILPQEARRILATPAMLQSQQVQEERDAEIEEYLRRNMPDLQRGGFFRRLRETQPHLKPGRRTSRTARSVLLHPRRLFTPDSLDPKKRKKGGNRNR